MLSGKFRITSLSVLVVLMFSTFASTLAFAAPESVSDKNWDRVNGNSWAQNFSPQTQITKDNVGNLEVKWLFPVPGVSTAPESIRALTPTEGSTTPPIVHNGIVYITTGTLNTIALDAKTGKQLWSNQYSADLKQLKERAPISIQAPHMHGIRYWEGGDAIITPGLGCDFRGLDAKTGKEKFTIGPLCIDVPGSIYPYQTSLLPNSVADVGTYEKGRLFIAAISTADGKSVKSGRSAIVAVDMDNPSKIVWRVFTMPPQDRPVDDWALQQCDKGWFYTIPCSEVQSKAPQNLMNDWQYKPGVTPHWTTGATANWGEVVIDEELGYVYLATGDPTPWPNIEYRPGPNLYANTLIAIDMNSGQMAWWVQDSPRDPWDYDCNWNGLLADDTSLGKVYVKGCKIGFLHVRDAKTGKPIHWIDVLAPDQVDPKMTPLRSDHLGAKKPLNPLDENEMKKFTPRTSYNPPYSIRPNALHGAFGSDISYHDGTVFHFAVSSELIIKGHPWPENPEEFKEGGLLLNADYGNTTSKATLVARDLVTGKVKWTYFYPTSGVRAFSSITGGMVYAPFPDGYMRFLDEKTGKLLREMNLGAPGIIGSTVGKDSDGNSKIFTLLGRSGFAFYQGGGLVAGVPNTLVALGLSEKAAEVKTTTVTSTSATTVTTTAPGTTVTSQITQTTGLPSEVTYAAVGVAVMALIAAAVLMMRKK